MGKTFHGGEVGKNIAYLRKKKGYTQEEMATKLHVTQSAASQFERNGESIQQETLKKICRVLNVHPAFLFHPALNNEKADTHDVLLSIILNYPQEEQLDKFVQAVQSETIQHGNIEQRNNAKPDKLSSLCMSIFNSLNAKGKDEAIKRINELAQLDQYKKED